LVGFFTSLLLDASSLSALAAGFTLLADSSFLAGFLAGAGFFFSATGASSS
jgi:hypothetical protein